jgi:hypothetical protein
MKELSTYKFFDLVLSGKFGTLDIDNYVQKITDNHDPGKLSKLLNDIEFRLFDHQIEREGNLTDKDYEEAFEYFRITGKEIPYKTIGSIVNKMGETIADERVILDIEKLIYPYEYVQIYAIIGRLKRLIKEPIKPPKRTKEPTIQNFEELFINPDHPQMVRDILELKGYAKNGHWRNESGNRSEPAYAYYVLKPLFVDIKDTPGIKVFFKEFGLPENHISDRQKTNKPGDYNKRDFERIFAHLIPK